jgi:hypothetical protein
MRTFESHSFRSLIFEISRFTPAAPTRGRPPVPGAARTRGAGASGHLGCPGGSRTPAQRASGLPACGATGLRKGARVVRKSGEVHTVRHVVPAVPGASASPRPGKLATKAAVPSGIFQIREIAVEAETLLLGTPASDHRLPAHLAVRSRSSRGLTSICRLGEQLAKTSPQALHTGWFPAGRRRSLCGAWYLQEQHLPLRR